MFYSLYQKLVCISTTIRRRRGFSHQKEVFRQKKNSGPLEIRILTIRGLTEGLTAGPAWVPRPVGDKTLRKPDGLLARHQHVSEASNSAVSSAAPTGRGESLVTRCCGSVPATSVGTSASL